MTDFKSVEEAAKYLGISGAEAAQSLLHSRQYKTNLNTGTTGGGRSRVTRQTGLYLWRVARCKRGTGPAGPGIASAMHITASVYVNDAEEGLIQDIDEWLEGLAPYGKDYRHHRTGEDNGDAHLKSLLMHHEVTVPITKGKPDLGPWQQIYYAEFDGRRKKRVIIKAIGE